MKKLVFVLLFFMPILATSQIKSFEKLYNLYFSSFQTIESNLDTCFVSVKFNQSKFDEKHTKSFSCKSGGQEIIFVRRMSKKKIDRIYINISPLDWEQFQSQFKQLGIRNTGTRNWGNFNHSVFQSDKIYIAAIKSKTGSYCVSLCSYSFALFQKIGDW